MARANFSLSSGRASTGNRAGGSLRPSLLSLSAGSNTRAPQVNVSAANARWSDIRAPRQVQQNPMAGAVDLASVLARETGRYIDRQATLEANELVNQVNKKLFDTTYGTRDDTGKDIPGYLSQKGKSALGGYNAHIESLQSYVSEALGSVDSAVAQKAAIRINNKMFEYTRLAAKHRAKEFAVEEENEADMAIENIKLEGVADPENIFTVDPTTGMTKVDTTSRKYGRSTEEVLAIKSAVILNTFEGLANKEGKRSDVYGQAVEWYGKYKGNMTADDITHIRSKLQVMKNAAEVELRADRAKALQQQRAGLYRGGSDVVAGMLRGGSASYEIAGSYVDQIRSLYPDDPRKTDDLILQQMKDAAKALAVSAGLPMEASHSYAMEQMIKLRGYMRDQGIESFYAQGKDLELDEYLTSGLMDELRQEEQSRENFYFAGVERGVRKDVNVIHEGVDKGVLFFTNESQVKEAYEWAQPRVDDTLEMAKMRETAIREAVSYSKKKYSVNLSPDAVAVQNKLFEYAGQGVMFKSDVAFEEYMTSKDILNPSDRNALLRLRQDMRSPEGTALKNYTTEVLSIVRKAFRGTSGFIVNADGTIANPASVFGDVKGNSPEEANIRLELMNMAVDVKTPPTERVKNMQTYLEGVKKETGKDSLQDALEVKAVGVRTSQFVSDLNGGVSSVEPGLEASDVFQSIGDEFMLRLAE